MPTIAAKELRIHVPQFYRCPISLELMTDPVTLSTGQTYDRSSIEKWFAEGNRTCPVTRQPLQDLTLTPNHMLLRLIQSWCVANKSHGVERVPTPKQPAHPHQVASLLYDISSSCSRFEKTVALKRLRSLAKEDEKNRQLISNMAATPLLVSIVFGEVDPEEESFRVDEVLEEALGALILLPLSGKNIFSIAQQRHLSLLSCLLKNDSIELRTNAGSLIESLTSTEEASDELRCKVGEAPGVINGLVGLLRETHYSRAVKVGIKALFGICLSSSNLDRAVASGATSALLECLLRVEKGDAERALATIELLCKTEEGRGEVAGNALAVPVLRRMILKVSNQASENAAGTLYAICSHSEKVQEEAIEEGIFTKLLLLLQSECSVRAKKKARSLLKLLKENWGNHPCVRAPERTGVMPF